MTTTDNQPDDDVPGLDSPDKLKQWLQAKGIHFIVFDAQHFVDAMDLETIEVFQQLIVRYEQHAQSVDFDPTDDEWRLRATTPRGQLARVDG